MDSIRKATINDLASIVDIYNQAVKSKFATADIHEIDYKERYEWFNGHTPEVYPIYVYVINDLIVGWISLSPYRAGREALRFTVEISYYVHKDYARKSIGSRLMEYVINESTKMNYRTLFAIILDKNIASIKLLEKFGFTKWGHMPDIANFDGVECGHVYYGLRINKTPTSEFL